MRWDRIIIASVISFCMAIIVALVIERLGGAVGGFIGSIPTVIMPIAYIIMSEPRDLESRANSLCAAFIGVVGTNIFFMPCWKFIPPILVKKNMKGASVVWTTLFIATIVWFIVATILVLSLEAIKNNNHSIFTFAVIVMSISSVVAFALCWNPPPTPKGTKKVPPYIHLCRGLASGIIIFLSSWLSQLGIGVIAGALSTFPAIYSTTMVSVSLMQGAGVSTGAIGPMLAGGLGVGWYSVITAAVFRKWEPAPMVAVAIGFVTIVLGWDVPVFLYIRWRRRVLYNKDKLPVQQIAATQTSEKPPEIQMEKEVKTAGNNEEMLSPGTVKPVEK